MLPEAKQPLIAFRDVVKSFGATQALKGVSVDVYAGEILALLGENGAGKSTLIKALAGIVTLDKGDIFHRGRPYRHRPPRFGARSPVAFIHQDLGLIEWMSISENIALCVGYPRRFGRIDWAAADATASRALALMGCDIDPRRRIHDLGRTEKSLVAIARALAVDCDVIVLDEPSASLPADEVHRLFNALRPLTTRGVGMIYVSHRLDEVFEIADRVAVLRDGRLVAECLVANTTPHALVTMIVGKALADTQARQAAPLAPDRLVVRGLSVEGAGPVDFAVARGHCVGLAGLRGAGQERIGRALFGCAPHTGSVTLDGIRPDLASPRTAMACGIGLIARERTEDSTAGGLSIRENFFLNPGAFGRGHLQAVSRASEAALARDIGDKVGLRPNNPDLQIEALSGGNQQKVVVGRWLGIAGSLLIAEDPTAGVDVGAKAEIYGLLDKALESGLSVLVVSTDFEEVARICDRVLVFSRGQIVAELSGRHLTVENLVQAACVAKPVAA